MSLHCVEEEEEEEEEAIEYTDNYKGVKRARREKVNKNYN